MPKAPLHRTTRIFRTRPRLLFSTQKKRVGCINQASLTISVHCRFHILPRGTLKARVKYKRTRILTWTLHRYLVAMELSKQNNLIVHKPVADQVTNKIGKLGVRRQNRWRKTNLGQQPNRNSRIRLIFLQIKTR